MPRRACLLALLLGLALAVGVGACGSDDGSESAVTVPSTPLTETRATVPTITATTPTTTTQTATTPPATTPTATTTVPTTPATTPTTPATTGTSTQASGGAPAGCPSAVGGFIRDVSASGADCSVARSVATAWFDAIHGGAAPDTPIEAAGYTCAGTLSGERASVACSGSGGASVTFTASP
jgi:hypothetical protein